MMKQFYPCDLYQYQLMIVGTYLKPKNGMVSLDCNMAGVTSASVEAKRHTAIHGTAEIIQLPVRKILLVGAPALKRCSQMDFKGTDKMERTS